MSQVGKDLDISERGKDLNEPFPLGPKDTRN